MTATSVAERAEQHIIHMAQTFQAPPQHPLTPEQQAIMAGISTAPRGLYIIDGVAGSGKTHVAQDLEFILNTIRLCKGAQTIQEALLHIAVIFVGDPKQLRAICKHMRQHPAWKTAQHFRLDVCLRAVSDQDYAKLTARDPHTLAQEEIYAVLEQCYCTREEALASLTPETLVLCTHRCQATVQHPSQGSTILSSRKTTAERLYPKSKSRFSFHSVACETRVMLLKNTSVARGLMNGSIGTVLHITLDTDRQPKSISIRFDGTQAPVTIHRSVSRAVLLGGTVYRKTTFPLTVCHAITGHKAKGATINHPVIIDIQDTFCHGLIYTMLTRTTNRQHLKIIGRITVDMFCA
eukprot:jgi/Botrbrau1/8271/Bobra.0001s0022.1